MLVDLVGGDGGDGGGLVRGGGGVGVIEEGVVLDFGEAVVGGLVAREGAEVADYRGDCSEVGD